MDKNNSLLQFYNIESLKKYLFVGLPSARKSLFSGGQGFGRSAYFYNLLGNPQDVNKTIHIAGTSGKGSTSYYLSSLLVAHGFNVGTHLSPHVYDLRESALINLKYISEDDYLANFNKVIPTILQMEDSEWGLPTYFEVLLAGSFEIFSAKKVDYCVLETGLGGRFDSTNTITRSDKIAVLTKLGFDHTEVLGESIEEIAYQKAGIINKKSLAISVTQPKDAEKVIKNVADEQSAQVCFENISSKIKNIKIVGKNVTFDFVDQDYEISGCSLSSPAIYQAENAAYAITVLKQIAKRDGFEIDKNKIKTALQTTIIPARSEFRQVGSSEYLLDGAHNPQKMESFGQTVAQLELTKKPVVILGLKKNKDVKGVVEQVIKFADKVIVTEFFRESENKYLRNFSSKAEEICEIIKKLAPKIEVFVEKKPQNAVKLSKKISENQLIVITGSLYLLSEVNEFI